MDRGTHILISYLACILSLLREYDFAATISYWNVMGESDSYLGGAARRCASIHGGSDFTVMELQISIVDDRLCLQSICLPFVSRLKEIRGLQGITMLCRSHHIAFGLADAAGIAIASVDMYRGYSHDMLYKE
ncbi:hypothetical protein Tco_1316687 [Tanacetum coccineum]